MHDSGVPVQDTGVAETVAELLKVPNSPKTKPAIEVAATMVTAIRITVASMGEIPFLLLLSKFIGVFIPKSRNSHCGV